MVQYGGWVSRSSFTLAALATVAVPGVEPAAVQLLESTTDFDMAKVQDVKEQQWIVKAPRSVLSGAAMEGEVALLDNLAAQRESGHLPFDVPRPRGFASLPEGGRAMVYPHIIGAPLNAAKVEAIAPAVATAIGAIHSLPTAVLESTGLPTYSASEFRQRRLADLDEAAQTGKVPPRLLGRWESACEDVRLWNFAPTIVHGDLAPDHIFIHREKVSGIIEWASAQVGDPAEDLAPLLSQAPERAMDALLNAYAQARRVTDEFLLARTVLSSELMLLRWLMHGVHNDDGEIITDAQQMLNELDYVTVDTLPINEIGVEPPAQEPAFAGHDEPGSNAPEGLSDDGNDDASTHRAEVADEAETAGEPTVSSFAAPGSGVVPLTESDSAEGADVDDEMPTVEIPRSLLDEEL